MGAVRHRRILSSAGSSSRLVPFLFSRSPTLIVMLARAGWLALRRTEHLGFPPTPVSKNRVEMKVSCTSGDTHSGFLGVSSYLAQTLPKHFL